MIDLARLLRRYAFQPSSSTRSTAADSSTVVWLSTARAFASVQDANAFDLYKVLGISSEASALEIKVAYRKLAKALHPDRNPGDQIAEKQFAALHEAYTILGNAELRAIYDSEMERIRRSADVQCADADGGGVARRHWHIWNERPQSSCSQPGS
jgi:DnaJ-domain-containing protein 1